MSRIEVTPAALLDMADRLHTTNVVARRARSALSSAGPEVTGSVELTTALSEHAQAWEWCLERLSDRLLSGSRALADAARAYGRIDEAVGAAAAAATARAH